MAAVRDFWVRAALVLAFLLPVYFVVAAFGTKYGLFDWRIGFGLMTFQLGALVMMGVLGFALVGLGLALLVPPRGRGALGAVLALAIPLAGIGYGAYVRSQSQGIPLIHDITTDQAEPPGFSAEALQRRAATPDVNPVDARSLLLRDHPKYAPMAKSPRLAGIADKTVADLQAEGYPDLAPIRVGLPPAEAFTAARDVAAAQGWTVVKADAATGVIEAEAQTFWYGFVDDIAVRVRPAPDSATAAIVDVRSVSRVGLSDLGANARRIRAFRDALLAADGAA